MEPKKGEDPDKQGTNKGGYSYLALGISLGLIFGMLLHNIAVGVALGAAVGVLLSFHRKS